MERLDTSRAIASGIKLTMMATGSLAAGAGVSHVAAAPAASTFAHGLYGWDGWSFGAGAAFNSYQTGVTTTSSDVYGSDLATNLNLKDWGPSLDFGKDIRAGNHVFGIYGDLSLGNTSKSFGSSDTYDGPGGTLGFQEKASVTGRAGVLLTPSALLYGLAGWSVQHYTASINASDDTYEASTFGASHEGFISGPTVGVGTEIIFPGDPFMSLKGEYRFTRFGAPTVPTAFDGTGSITANFKPVNDSEFRVILSVKLGP